MAAAMLREKFSKIHFSSVYQTKAMEVEEQEDFLNAVAQIETEIAPEEVLEALQRIEKALKKNPPYRFGPRTIDLDLLLYNDRVMDSDILKLPHPGMQGRRFVLEPLCDVIDVNTKHPILETSWKELLTKTQDQECRKIDFFL